MTKAGRMEPDQFRDSVRAVCFDLDGTLYPQGSLRLRMAGLLAHAWSRGRLSLAELQILRLYRRRREETRRVGKVKHLEAFVVESTAKAAACSADRVQAVVRTWLHEAPLPLLSTLANPRLRETLQRLRLRGYGLAVFSDYPVRKKLEALRLPEGLFDVIVEAGDPGVNALKPHAQGFTEVCRRLNLPPSQVLFVGDRSEIDGKGARAAGMPFMLCSGLACGASSKPALRRLEDLEWRLSVCRENHYVRPSTGCWLCGATDGVEFAPDRLPDDIAPALVKVTDAHYGVTAQLLKCQSCGFIHASAESAKRLEASYRGVVDHEYEESSVPRRRIFADLLSQIRLLRPTARTLLDVGASTGLLCDEATRVGFGPEGVEPSTWAVTEGQRRYRVRLHEGYFPHPALEGRRFDVVMLCDVIEHVSEPIEMLQAARRCLTPQGLLVVVTPDVSSRMARMVGRRWWHFRPGHIGYFSRETMYAALGAAGFCLLAVKPYVWWLPLGYLIKRLGEYVPVSSLRRLVSNRDLKGPYWDVGVPLCFWDSYVYFAGPIEPREEVGLNDCSLAREEMAVRGKEMRGSA